jgi:hypothetical protein
MQSDTRRKYQRRNAAEWRALLYAQATSGLSVGTFCRKVSDTVLNGTMQAQIWGRMASQT